MTLDEFVESWSTIEDQRAFSFVSRDKHLMNYNMFYLTNPLFLGIHEIFVTKFVL